MADYVANIITISDKTNFSYKIWPVFATCMIRSHETESVFRHGTLSYTIYKWHTPRQQNTPALHTYVLKTYHGTASGIAPHYEATHGDLRCPFRFSQRYSKNAKHNRHLYQNTRKSRRPPPQESFSRRRMSFSHKSIIFA